MSSHYPIINEIILEDSVHLLDPSDFAAKPTPSILVQHLANLVDPFIRLRLR